MILEYKCSSCKNTFESNNPTCPKCGNIAKKQFHATSNVFIPAYFHTSRSDIFTDKEWQDLKKDPNVERAK